MMAADLNPLFETEAEKFPALAVTQKPEFNHLETLLKFPAFLAINPKAAESITSEQVLYPISFCKPTCVCKIS
jgi:hypothetical protein